MCIRDSLKPDTEAATTDQMLTLVKSELGLAFVPEPMAKEALERGEDVYKRQLLENGITVVAVNKGIVPNDQRREQLAFLEDVFFKLLKSVSYTHLHPAVRERLAAAYDRCCHEEKTCTTVEEKTAWMILPFIITRDKKLSNFIIGRLRSL